MTKLIDKPALSAIFVNMNGQHPNFDIILKQNGQAFARYIRDNASVIFDIPNIVDIVKYAGRKSAPITPYLISLLPAEERGLIVTDKTIEELAASAGYNAFFPKTHEEFCKFTKYYLDDRTGATFSNELLCWYDDKKFTDENHVLVLVKKNIDTILRKNFIGEHYRDDEYGTSILVVRYQGGV